MYELCISLLPNTVSKIHTSNNLPHIIKPNLIHITSIYECEGAMVAIFTFIASKEIVNDTKSSYQIILV